MASADQAREVALAQASRATDNARAAARAYPLTSGHIDAIIEMKAAGVTPEYVNAMRDAAPRLRSMDPTDFAGMKAVGVTPEFARGLTAAGFHNITAEELTEARAVGLTGDYVRAIASAGIPLNVDDYVQLRAVGVPTDYVQSLRQAGYAVHDADKLVEMWAVGVRPGDLRGLAGSPAPPVPPRPPRPHGHTGRPAASPPDWDPVEPDGG
jgi:hypothetical protein